jgi:hypothetical protein
MGRVGAERAFGIATKHVHGDIPVKESTLRENLRGLLADHRVMLDSGMNVAVQQDPANWQSALAAVRLSAPSTQPSSTLPLCDRWGEFYSKNATFVSRKVAQNDVLAHDSRHSLPCATRAAGKGGDVGPGCNMRAEMNSHWLEPMTYTQICQGMFDLGDSPSDEPADAIALQMDGDRVWPPRALLSSEWADTTTVLVKELCDKLDGVEPRVAKTNGIGAYIMAVRGILNKLHNTGAKATRSEQDFLGLGIGIFARNPMAFHSVRKRALHAAMAAHMRDRGELGAQLERLSHIIVRLHEDSRRSD